MAADQDQVVWFPKDSLLGVVVHIPLWGIAGLFWGLVMALFMAGSLLGWLFAGLLWGATCWFFFAIYLLIWYRELSTSITLPEAGNLPQLLAEAVKGFWYTVEQKSPSSFVCKPKHGLFVLLRFDFTKLYVLLHDGSADLIGPAVVVNKVRKKLQAG